VKLNTLSKGNDSQSFHRPSIYVDTRNAEYQAERKCSRKQLPESEMQSERIYSPSQPRLFIKQPQMTKLPKRELHATVSAPLLA